MNQTTIMGHLGADPEVRFTSSGQKVTTLRMACNQRRSGKEETIWWRVTIWGEQFDKMMPYVKKGSGLIVAGEMLKPEIYNNKEGQPQISLNLVAYQLSFPPFGKGDRQQGQQEHSREQQSSYEGGDFGSGGQQSMEQGQGHHHDQHQFSHSFAEDEIPF